MGRTTTAKCKRCRRETEKLFLKGERCYTPKCAVTRRGYPPGRHGQTSGARLSEYGVQLREKQKAKKIFGLRERQFVAYVRKAEKKKGVTGEIMLRSLEMRLDNLIYRLGLAGSRAAARQLVKHGQIKVNSRKVNIPSYRTRVKDVVEVADKGKKNKYFKQATKTLDPKSIPSWLDFDIKKLKATVRQEPPVEELEMSIKPELIVEYYSR